MSKIFQGGIKNKGRFFKNLSCCFSNCSKGGKNMKRAFFVLTLAVLLALIGWGCQKTATPDAGQDVGPDAGGDAGIPEGWKEYRNEELGFSFWYPEEWQLRVENEVPFTWDGIEYKLVDVQLLDQESRQYIGAYSFAVAENSERLPLADWLEQHNTVGDPFTLIDEKYNEIVPGKKFVYATGVTLSPDQHAFPAGFLVFSSPGNTHVFFPDIGQDHSIFEVYGISAEDFAFQIRSTFRFTR